MTRKIPIPRIINYLGGLENYLEVKGEIANEYDKLEDDSISKRQYIKREIQEEFRFLSRRRTKEMVEFR